MNQVYARRGGLRLESRQSAQGSIYLDNAATSFPKPPDVIRTMASYMIRSGASAGRGGYRRAIGADGLLKQVRSLLARLFNIPDSERIVFTSNVTEALNLALRGYLRPGDRVITSSMEHHAVWRTLMSLRRERGVEVSVIRCSARGTMDLEDALRKLDRPARLMAITHASNVSGGIFPLDWLGRACRHRGIPLLVDSAQTAGVIPLDVVGQSIDMLAFTGHKGLLGPMGTGGLYVREGISLRHLKTGGTGTRSRESTQPFSFPDGYEAGTHNVPGIVGLGAACEFHLTRDPGSIWRHKRRLVAHLLEGLSSVQGLSIYGPGDPSRMVGVVSFNLAGRRPAEVAKVLDRRFGIMLRAGYHCAPCAHRTLGTQDRGSLRASVGAFTRKEEVEALVMAMDRLSSLGRRPQMTTAGRASACEE